MPVPRSVQEAAQRADETIRKQREAKLGIPATAPAAPDVAAAPTPAPAPAPAEPQQVAAEPAPTPAPAFADAGWEKRFKVLQGKYDAEVPRLHQEMRELKAQLQDALSKINSLPAAPDLSALTPEEREQYGDDFIKVVAKVAKANAPAPAQHTAPVDDGLNDRLARIENAVSDTREDQFFRELGNAAKNWEALNTDAGFLKWLATEDQLSGKTRQEMFNDAYNRLDVKRVANFFNSYAGNQSSVERTSQVPSLESQVTPRPNGSAPAPPQGKKLWTSREIAQFYTAVRRNEYRGREADMARIEQDIFAAQTEGRVRP